MMGVALSVFTAWSPESKLMADAITPHANITVHLNAAGRDENPHMWGIFLEDINNCVDGGLYAQLIRNPDFQNAVPPPDCTVAGDQWRLPNGNLIAPPKGGALYGWSTDRRHPLHLTLLRSHPLSPAHPLSLRLTARRPGDAVVNSGYWGMNVTAGRSYQLSLYARSPDPGRQMLTARFINSAGRALGPQVFIKLSGAAWKRYVVRLHAAATDPRARLQIALARPGSVVLTLALLYPVNSRTHQIEIFRPDLVRLLRNLKPGFVRFPGGNYIEGVSIGDSYDWRKTVGPMIDRPGHFDCWGYRSTDGFGFLQYLELCQKLHAIPLYGTFAGEPLGFFYHVNPVPSATGQALDPFIHRMLTAVAFADDPMTGKWGVLRASCGHPAPFGLKYVELGNENGGAVYVKNAMRMAEALKKKFPHVIPIRTAWSARLAKMVPLGDEHYYASPDMFYVDSKEFDHRPRNTPVRSFVGEYADIGHCEKHGDMRGALAEAAYMTGMERNCDVVRMASYAPLFQNTDGYQWQPDLIEFNTSRAFGRSSYWVQWIFTHYRPAIVYPTSVIAHVPPSMSGRIALETQHCKAEFQSIQVREAGRLVMHTGPRGPLGGLIKWRSTTWHAGWGPDWQMQHGILSQAGDVNGNQLTAFGRLGWTDYTLDLQVKKRSGAGGVRIWVRRDPAGLNGAILELGGPDNNKFALLQVHDRKVSVIKSIPGNLRTGRWYRVKIVLHGQRVLAFLDGRMLFAGVVHDTPPRFFADAGLNRTHSEMIIKLTNTLSCAIPAHVDIDGNLNMAPTVQVTTLSARHDSEENSYRHPFLISPHQGTYRVSGRSFTYICVPYSLTVLRIKIRK